VFAAPAIYASGHIELSPFAPIACFFTGWLRGPDLNPNCCCTPLINKQKKRKKKHVCCPWCFSAHRNQTLLLLCRTYASSTSQNWPLSQARCVTSSADHLRLSSLLYVCVCVCYPSSSLRHSLWLPVSSSKDFFLHVHLVLLVRFRFRIFKEESRLLSLESSNNDTASQATSQSSAEQLKKPVFSLFHGAVFL
jgi:hypothetical protein